MTPELIGLDRLYSDWRRLQLFGESSGIRKSEKIGEHFRVSNLSEKKVA